MKKLLTSSRIALRALQVNRTRSALTMLGIIIGVAAVIAMVGVGAVKATDGHSSAIAFASSVVSVATPPDPSRTPLLLMLPGKTMIRLLPML